jgi:DNA adenine methylase
MTTLRAPYPWFGGKSRVARTVWRRLGDVTNYVEPFFGSGAVLLSRPHFPFAENRIETVNDLDGMVANFWRALAADPEAVAAHADWPVSECDLHARHLWLANEGRRHVERLKTEPDYFDAKIAGWWVWGCCQWIGAGWCEHPEWEQRPHLGDAGMGVNRPGQELHDYFAALAERLRRVRVCCGDWLRVCGPTPTVKQGLTGVFLDPPYSQAERDGELYAVESDVAPDVRRWCLENGADKRLRVVLCGYAGEGHEELEAHGWDVVAWKAPGGYGSRGSGTAGRENAKRERVWFSPHCLKAARQTELFAETPA